MSTAGRCIDPEEFLSVTVPALSRGDANALADAVRSRWTCSQLLALLDPAQRDDVRRLATVILGFVGDCKCIAQLARLLQDSDPHLHELAEHSLWALFFRQASPAACCSFQRGVGLLETQEYRQAIEAFQQAASLDPRFAECHNQAAMAHFFLGEYPQAIQCCQRALELNPHHFGALACLGHCHAQQSELDEALYWYRRTLAVNPRMPAVARAIKKIEQLQKRSNDASGCFRCVDLPR